MRCGASGVTRKRFEASDSVDVSNRFVCTHRSARNRVECHSTVGLLELAKCVRTVCKLHDGLLGWRSIRSHFFLPIERLDLGSPISGVWQSHREPQSSLTYAPLYRCRRGL